MKRAPTARQKLLQLVSGIGCSTLLVSVVTFSLSGQAYQPTSMRQPHPLGWMHFLPVGEQPGWKSEKWSFIEIGNSNIWSAPLTMKNTRNGDTYEYRTDYEQISAIAEVGTAVNKKLAVSMEIPFAYRAGGFMDGIVDEVHDIVGTRTFNREKYGRDEHHYSIKTNGKEEVTSGPLKSISNIKPKMKWWFRQKVSKKNPCPCGTAISAQLKIPVQNESYGAANGHLEPSVLVHYGIPIGTQSAAWFTAALTKMGADPQMQDWPLKRYHQMYEMSYDIGLSNRWGILFQARMDSPLMERSHLSYVDNTNSTTAKEYVKARSSTAWNSLIRWQGMQALGVRYRDQKTQVNVLIAEDWGLGPYDAADSIYSNNAPDINFVVQTSIAY